MTKVADPHGLGLVADDTPEDPTGLGLVPDEPTTLQRAGQVAAGVGKAADYQRGAVAAGIAHAVEGAGGPQMFSAQDFKNALSPLTSARAPGYGEMMQRAGVPEGPSTADLPNWGPRYLRQIRQALPTMTTRGAAGAAADVALDPMTYESMGAGKIGEALSPISRMMKRGSTSLYESAIRPIIQAGERYGNPNVGKTMLEAGIRGTPPAIEEGMQTAAKGFKSSRDAILSEATGAGAAASKDAAITPTFEQLQQMVRDQRLTPNQASQILQDLTLAKQRGGDLVTPELMTQWKTDAAQALPGATWDELSKSSPSMANNVGNTLRKGYQSEVERAVERATGRGGELASTNRQLGDLINPDVERAAASMANAYEKKPIVTSSDLLYALAGMGAGGVIHSGHTAETGAAVVALKKAIEAARSTRIKTTLGVMGDRVLNTPGVSPAVDAASRQIWSRELSPYQSDRK